MLDWTLWCNPETLMVNLMNIGLGIFVLWIVLTLVLEVLCGWLAPPRH